MRYLLIPLLFFVYYQTAAQVKVPDSGFENADKLVSHVISKRWKAAIRLTSDDVQRALSPSKLKKAWMGIEEEYGELEKISSLDTQHTAGGYTANYKLLFERAAFDLRVVLDLKDQVTSFLFLPLNYQMPDRMLGKIIQAEHVVVETDTFRMNGELMIPDSCNNCPVVVIVHGSGPASRDLEYGPNKIYLDLALFLAEKGIASLRYDKRTYVYKDLYKEQFDSLTVDDITVDDALSAIRLVRSNQLTDSSPVFLVGHSLGALMAPRIALRDKNLKGVILLAGPTMPLHHLIDYQVRLLLQDDGRMKGARKKMINKVSGAVEELDKGNYYYKEVSNLGPWGGSFWKDILSYDPVATTVSHGMPSFVIYCERDYQVPPASNASAWDGLVDSSDHVKMTIYPGLNHLFLYGEGEPNRGEYLNPGHFSEKVINDIVEWITETEMSRTKR